MKRKLIRLLMVFVVATCAAVSVSFLMGATQAVCNDTEACATILDPVCGNDYHTYSNQCYLDHAYGISVLYKGVCCNNDNQCPGSRPHCDESNSCIN